MTKSNENELVHSQSIEKIIPYLDFKPTTKQIDKIGYMFEWMTKYHIHEELITNEFIVTPRGYQFIAEVFVPADRLSRILYYDDAQKAKKVILYYDSMWTKKWVRITEKSKNISFQEFPNQDLSAEDFCLQWLLKKNNIWNAWLSNHTDFKKKYIYKKGNRNWITKEGSQAYLESDNIGDQIRRMSFFISRNLSGLKQSYSFIQKQNLKKEKIMFKSLNDEFMKRYKIRFYDLRIFYSNVDKVHLFLANTLKKHHPHECFMFRKASQEKYKRGHIITSFYGVNWFQTVFIDFYNKKNLILEKDLKWTLEQMKEKNIDVDFYTESDVHDLKKIYLLNDMAIKYIIHEQLPKKDYSETLVLSKEEVKILEDAYPILKLRHCSYLLSPITSIPELKREAEEETRPNPRRKYLDVRDLDVTKNYKGQVLHRSNVKIDKLNQVPIRTVPVKLDDGRKVRLRMPEWILEGHHQRFFLEKYAPIKFGLEKTKEGNVRISWFTTYETIFLKLDWSNSLLDYVKVPKMGRSKGKESTSRKSEPRVNYICQLSIEDEELIHDFQEKNTCGSMYSVYYTLMQRYHFEKEKIGNLKLLKDEIKACEDDLAYFQKFKNQIPEKVFSKLDQQYRDRNEMVKRYTQGYEKLFCQKSNILTCPVEPINREVKIKKKKCRMKAGQKVYINQIITEYGYRNFREWLLANLTIVPQQRIDAWQEMLDDKRNEVYWLDMMLIFSKHQFQEGDYMELKKRFDRMIDTFGTVQDRLYELTEKVIQKEGFYDRHSKMAD